MVRTMQHDNGWLELGNKTTFWKSRKMMGAAAKAICLPEEEIAERFGAHPRLTQRHMMRVEQIQWISEIQTKSTRRSMPETM